jgi:hypothetical protein
MAKSKERTRKLVFGLRMYERLTGERKAKGNKHYLNKCRVKTSNI